MPTVEEKVKDMLERLLLVDQTEMTPGSLLQQDLGADSLDMVEIVMELEGTFDLVIPDDAAENMRTINDIYNLVEKNKLAAPKN